MTSQDPRSEHDTPEPDAARALRQQAEARIGNDAAWTATDLAALTPGEIRRTLHELRVHQIELTLQNEELRRAQAEIDAARARYFDLYELAPVGYCTLSETGLILEANLTAASLLETPKSALIKQPLSRFIVKDDQDLYYLQRKRLIETDQPQEIDLRLAKPDSACVWVRLTANAALAEDGAPVCRVVISDITGRKAIEATREEALNRLRKIASRVPGMVYQYRFRADGSSCFPFASEAIRDIYRVSPEDVREDASPVFAVIHPDDVAGVVASIQNSAQELIPWQFEYRVRFADGTVRWLFGNALPEREADGAVLWHGFITDISARKLDQQAIQLAAGVFSHANEGIMITASDGTILEINEAFTAITGYRRDEVVGKNPRLLGSGRQDQAFYAALWRTLLNTGQWSGELWNRRRNGDLYAVLQNISAMYDAQGNTHQYVALFSDITAIKEHERRLEHLAQFDTLTALPNRVLLADRLHQAMAQTQRRGQRLAVGYLDLDGFKTINDQHGHAVGDQVLVAVAKRMLSVLREGDTLARLGGDEFAVVLIDLTDDEVSVPLLNRLLAATAEPVRVGDLLVQVSASLGVTFYPQAGGVDGDLLLRQADQAMYQAKQSGKNRYYLFDTELDQRIRGHHEDLEQIRHALAAHEFVLYYQPKVNLRTGRVIGAEALIRWRHPQRGLLAPALFLPTTENHPLAVELGEWVIKTALAQIEAWQALGLALPVSVNVGAYQLQQVDFVARLRALLGEHPEVAPSCLCLEILETSAIDDLVGTAGMIGACRELGVSVALDDFGTGYSSLTYLKRLAVTQLKIDRSFVSGMLNDPEDLAIVESVLSLAGTFNLQVIAEGVETLEHGEMLLSLGCDLAQGFGIARPMPAHEMPGWLAAWQTPAGWAELPTVRREHLPLLYASVEHRAWIAAIDAHLRSEQGLPPLPPLDVHQCRFAAWLRAEVASGYGAEPGFQRIDALHQQVHEVVGELLELRAHGRHPEALARLGEVHDLRDTLLDGLKEWMRERGRSTAMIGEARLSDLSGHLGQAR